MSTQQDVGELAKMHLSAFVPVEIRELQKQGGPSEVLLELARERMQPFREEGAGHAVAFLDKGQTRKEMALLTECLAVLAFVPGGVKFAGLHFDATQGGTISWGHDAEEDDQTNDGDGNFKYQVGQSVRVASGYLEGTILGIEDRRMSGGYLSLPIYRILGAWRFEDELEEENKGER